MTMYITYVYALPSVCKAYWPMSFGVGFSLMWDWGVAKTFDVDSVPTQTKSFNYIDWLG